MSWIKISKIMSDKGLTKYETLDSFIKELEYIKEDDSQDYEKIVTQFRKDIPSTFRMIDSENNGDEFQLAIEFFKVPSTDLGVSNKSGSFPSLELGDTRRYNADGYYAVLEGEMTWGLWVSPEFIRNELPKLKKGIEKESSIKNKAAEEKPKRLWQVIEWGKDVTDDGKVKKIRDLKEGEKLLKVFDDDGNYYASVACVNDDAAEMAFDNLSSNYGATSSTLDGEPFIG